MPRLLPNFNFTLNSFLNPAHAPTNIKRGFFEQVNEDIHFMHTVKGRGTLHMGGRTWTMLPDSVLCMKPYRKFAVEVDDSVGMEMINIHCQLTSKDGLPIMQFQDLPLFFQIRKLDKVHKDLELWMNLWNLGRQFDKTLVNGRLFALVLDYFKEHGSEVTHAPAFDNEITDIKLQLEKNAHENYVAENYANMISLSVSQMNRKFKKAFGCTPKEYWQITRFNRIKTILIHSNDPMKKIADQFGFNSEHYFSRWFKLQCGDTPGKFRSKSRDAMSRGVSLEH